MTRAGAVTGAVVLGLGLSGAAAGAPPWSPPESISTASGVVAGQVALAGAPDGRAAAFFYSENTDRGDLRDAMVGAIRPRRGGRWRPPATLGGAEAVQRIPPVIAMSSRGEAVAAWTGTADEFDNSPRVAVLREGSARWEPAEEIPGAGRVSASSGGLAVRAGGDAAVSWAGPTDATRPEVGRDHSSVHVSVRPARSGVWSPARKIGGPATFGSRLAIAPDGTITAVWLRGPRPATRLESATRSPSGEWTAPEPVSPADVRARDASVVVDARGSVVAAWIADGIHVAERPPGQPWGPPRRISEPTGFPLVNPIPPAVALDDSGNAVAVWRRVTAPGRFSVEVSVRPVDGEWSTPERISPPAGRSVGHPALAVNRSGRSVIAWIQPGGSLLAVLGDAGRGGWSAPERVTGTPDEEPIEPQASIDGEGRPTIAWRARKIGQEQRLRPSFLRTSTRGATSARPVRLTVDQLLINQRISQAALRRVNAITARVQGGLTGADVRDGALGRQAFGSGVQVDGADSAAFLDAVGGRAIPGVAPPSGGAGVELTVDQLLINQRISQAALRRADAVAEALQSGLTGGNFVDASIPIAKVAPGLTLGSAGGPDPVVDPTSVRVRMPGPPDQGSALRLEPEQLLINQRIAQAAVLRVNALTARFTSGLTAEDIAPGSIGRRDITPPPG